MSVVAHASSPENKVRIVAFNVDRTLVEHDRGLVIWQLLNRRYGGSADINVQRYQAFKSGAITYAQWVDLDIAGWQRQGATRDRIIEVIRKELRLVADARQVTTELKRRGYMVVVVSGTLDIVLETLFPEHPFRHVFTNRIRFDDSGAIEGWTATAYDMAGKAEALRLVSRQTQVPTSAIAFVGDHTNDLEALALAGCPIAYDPKDDALKDVVRHVLPRGQLRRLLDLFPGPEHPLILS